ncbi:Translation initiation factor eIF-2B subunit epsilon, partial [Trichostrongylus colubriformis]
PYLLFQGLFPICGIPLINFTLSWIARTEVQKLLLVVSEQNVPSLAEVERNWKHCFESLSIVSCKDALNVGDALRELDSRGLLAGDFLLLSNPATITSSTLQAQIAAFRERRAENKNNVMTLIYSDLKTAKNAVVAFDKSTKKMKAYHKQEDTGQLDIDKSHFLEDAVVRQDIVDSGIALCSLNISAQFSDNFDFQHRDDVIREILVNEEILLQNIHVEVLSSSEAALCVTDYSSLLLISNLIMERWFYPLVLDRMVSQENYKFNSLPRNVYVAVNEEDTRKLSPFRSASKQVLNVTLGFGCDIDDSVVMACAVIGNGTKIGCNTRISNCIIGENCVIGANCDIKESVLGENVRIPDGTVVQKQSVISANVTYSHNLNVPSNAAICSNTPHEDFEEIITCKEAKGNSLFSYVSYRVIHNSCNRLCATPYLFRLEI